MEEKLVLYVVGSGGTLTCYGHGIVVNRSHAHCVP